VCEKEGDLVGLRNAHSPHNRSYPNHNYYILNKYEGGDSSLPLRVYVCMYACACVYERDSQLLTSVQSNIFVFDT